MYCSIDFIRLKSYNNFVLVNHGKVWIVVAPRHKLEVNSHLLSLYSLYGVVCKKKKKRLCLAFNAIPNYLVSFVY